MEISCSKVLWISHTEGMILYKFSNILIAFFTLHVYIFLQNVYKMLVCFLHVYLQSNYFYGNNSYHFVDHLFTFDNVIFVEIFYNICFTPQLFCLPFVIFSSFRHFISDFLPFKTRFDPRIFFLLSDHILIGICAEL